MLILSLAAGTAHAADEALLLDVEINGYATGKIGEFTQRGSDLLAQRAELTALGFRIPETTASGTRDLIALSALPGLTWRLDAATQTLYLAAAPTLLQPTVLRASDEPGADIAVQSGTGATLNYDLSVISAAGETQGSGLFDVRGFSPWGVASSGYLVRAGRRAGQNDVVRLESTYTYSQPETDRRYRLGDVISGGPGWSRPVRLAGVQITSDFSMRPDLVTFPLPTLREVAAVPSTLDVMANGSVILSREVGAGPFEVPQLPLSTGAGLISMALTDPLGRQVIAALPFYATSNLLAPGLQTYTAQAGAVRRRFGESSSDYGGFAALASYRRGVTPRLTLEGSAEAARGLIMTGLGLTANIADVVILDLAAAASHSPAGPGAQLVLGAQHFAGVFSYGLSATLASPAFRDVAAMDGDLPPRLRLGASAGLTLGHLGSVSLYYAGIDPQDDRSPSPLLPEADLRRTGGRSHVLSANYLVQVGRLAVYVVGFRELGDHHSGTMLFELTLPLGARASGSASVSKGPDGLESQVQVGRPATSVGDLGYQVHASSGQATHAFAELAYRTHWSLLSAGVDQLGGRTSFRAESTGAVSLLDHRLFASNLIQDSFAVVDTRGLGRVRVLSENRDAGRTSASGAMLVPDLRSFGVNRIDIAPLDIPLDASVDTTTRWVRPQDRSGVVVRFPVRVSHGALLRLVDGASQPLPVGSTAVPDRAGAAAAPVGYDGEAYVEDLLPHNGITVSMPDGSRCVAAFDYRAIPGEIPVIGPLICKAVQP